MQVPGASAKNGQQIGQENVVSVAKYVAALRSERKGLPARNGKISITAIALAVGIDKQSLYKNPGCRDLLEQAAQDLGLTGIESRETSSANKDDAKDRRISVLEQKCAALQAEVEGLRRQLRRYAHIEEHMISTGRRVIL